MTDYAKLVRELNNLAAQNVMEGVPGSPRNYLGDMAHQAATALETLMRERDEARLQCDGLEERGDLALEELNEARAENGRLREALEHILKQRAAIESGQIPRPIHNVLAAIDRALQALGEPND